MLVCSIGYWTVRLSCLSVLSVTLVYCGLMVGWIKVKLGMRVGLGPGHVVGPQFLAHVCCDQTVVWIKMLVRT